MTTYPESTVKGLLAVIEGYAKREAAHLGVVEALQKIGRYYDIENTYEGIAIHAVTTARKALATLKDGEVPESTLDALRRAGWSVGVHNDYFIGGERFTFWLLTYPDGLYVKGEGRTDSEAIAECMKMIPRSLLPAVTSG